MLAVFTVHAEFYLVRAQPCPRPFQKSGVMMFEKYQARVRDETERDYDGSHERQETAQERGAEPAA